MYKYINESMYINNQYHLVPVAFSSEGVFHNGNFDLLLGKAGLSRSDIPLIHLDTTHITQTMYH